MVFLHFFFILLSLFMLLCALRYVAEIRNSRLYQVVFRYPPCLWELPIVGSLYHMLYGSSEYAMKKIIEIGYNTAEAGGITRLYGLNTYYLDASDVAEALTTFLDKDFMYTFLQAITNNGSVFAPEVSKSKVRRRVLLPSFTVAMVSSYVDSLWTEAVGLTEVLAPRVGRGPFAAGPYLGAFCFNAIFSSADIQDFRKEFCTLKLLNDFHRCLKLVYDRWTTLWMYPDFVYKHTKNFAETRKKKIEFQNIAEKAYNIRKNKLLSMNSAANDADRNKEKDYELKRKLFDGLLTSKLPRTDIKEEIVVLVGASEEAGVVIGFALILLGQFPEVQDKVYEELTDIFGDSDRPIEKDDLPRLRYLDLVIKEVFRLYPSVPIILRKAHKEMTLSSGRVIPEGAGIMVPIVGLHRDPKYWGADADHFDPERFLPERLTNVHENAYIPFSYGARSCVGKKLGSYLVKVALCAVLRKYKVAGKPASGPIPDISTKFEVTLKSLNNFEIELENRT